MLLIFGILILAPIILTIWEGWFDCFYILLAVLLAVLTFIFMLIPTSVVGDALPDKTANVEKIIVEERIYAFEDNIIGTGNYFLFSGSYNESNAISSQSGKELPSSRLNLIFGSVITTPLSTNQAASKCCSPYQWQPAS